MLPVLSIDLASRRYRDIGIAVLRQMQSTVEVELIKPHERGLCGEPHPQTVAAFCAEMALAAGADLILLDGPQGWRACESEFQHMRVCERCTQTPGKTGIPGNVKPRTWTRMADFSVKVFDALQAAGWPRFSGALAGRLAIETFPTHAWKSLGLRCLPGKKRRRAPDVEVWAQLLYAECAVRWPGQPSHDEVQAVVAGLGGIALQRYGLVECAIHGQPPFEEAGLWKEGFIVSPKEKDGGRVTSDGGPPAQQRVRGCYCGRSG